MRRSQVLLQQHVGRMFRDMWKYQGKRVLIDNGALQELKLRGIPYESAIDVVQEQKKPIELKLEPYPPKEFSMDETHPDYHQEPCLIYSDNNVLLGGLDQAKVFTNSCEMDLNTLPISERLNQSTEFSQDSLVKSFIKSSLLYDAYQEKLPKKKDPERPAFKFPRIYGITDRRKNFVLGKRLVQLCSSLNPQLLEQRRLILNPISFQVGIKRNGKNILLSNLADLLITTNMKIRPVIDPEVTKDISLSDIHPLSPLVSLEPHHIYKFEDISPLNENAEKSHVHTVVVHFNRTEVTNLYETEVTESQILARSLMKCYTFALAQARRIYGTNIVDLPEPITVQCIQMDSKLFHFSILQLNTTGFPEDTDIKNAYWNIPVMSLYDTCEYVDGIPVLKAYNPLVFQTLLKFFQNN